MKQRKVGQIYVSTPSTDGAGVHLRRIFHRKDTLDLDPFLMLDTFDSKNPEDYIKGFPLHPHRGIETFTYLISGEIIHKDSLGNKGTIRSGEYQWMRAGSGILHEEMPQKSDYMLGFQLWINMPQKEKMSAPNYLEGNTQNIPVIEGDGYVVHLLSGSFGGKSKTDVPGHVPTEIYDIALEANRTMTLSIPEEHHSFVSMLLGEATICGEVIKEKTAATFLDGDTIHIETGEKPARIMFFAGKPLGEPIAWGGPIVMNTQEELRIANEELRNGTFIKDQIKL